MASPQLLGARKAVRPSVARELRLWREGYRAVAGLDEVGRGPLAGPVTAGAVVLRPYARPAWLADVRDSKQLTAVSRRRIAAAIKTAVTDWAVGWASAWEVDDAGVVEATRRAMRRALAARAELPSFVLVDGTDALPLDCPVEAIVRGDVQVTSIAAASVLAKVARDVWMERADTRFRGYGFASNKGYGTAAHLAALERHGPCSQHRASFAPVRRLVAPP